IRESQPGTSSAVIASWMTSPSSPNTRRNTPCTSSRSGCILADLLDEYRAIAPVALDVKHPGTLAGGRDALTGESETAVMLQDEPVFRRGDVVPADRP